MKNFPVHGQNNYLLLKKLKNQTLHIPDLQYMQNTGNSIKMVKIAYKQHYIHRHSRLENSFTNFLYLALHSIQHHIALQCPDSLIVQIIFFTEFCFSWTINEYVGREYVHYSTVYNNSNREKANCSLFAQDAIIMAAFLFFFYRVCWFAVVCQFGAFQAQLVCWSQSAGVPQCHRSVPLAVW